MNISDMDITEIASDIEEALYFFHKMLFKELSQDWKDFSISIGDKVFEINSTSKKEDKNEVIKLLLLEAISFYLDNTDIFTDSEDGRDPFIPIYRILNGARKEDHQIEIIREEHVVDLDEQGNPIKAKPLNMNSIYVQWQDESKFPRNKSFDDLMKTRLTEEEIETIESEAIQELKEMQ